ncbi:hypothetical protein Mapa_014062 [Marchantia paleacea]|nr:hypothetical protein Mapa_014062 [Marchantia paleacea]
MYWTTSGGSRDNWDEIPNSRQVPPVRTKRMMATMYCHNVVGPVSETSCLKSTRLTRGPPLGSSSSALGSSTMNMSYLLPIFSLRPRCSLAKTSSRLPLRFPSSSTPSPKSPNGSWPVIQNVV